MARIDVDNITKVEKTINIEDLVSATYSVASIDNNRNVFQIDTYSKNEDGQVTQTLQFDTDNIGKLLRLISSNFESFTITLLDDNGEVKYGLNWGNRTGRNVNQAYLDLPIEIYKSSFFPTNGNRFIIRTDDNENIVFTRAQKDNVNGHALQTPEDNTILGKYIRKRLSLNPGEIITKESIEKYGRNFITISKIGDFYYLDFSSVEKRQETQPENIDTIEPSYRPYITAIKSKPFLLLAGISGTGKSRIVRELARACWDAGSEEYKAHKPKNFEMVQVKPNWHDSSELLGYVSRIDGEKFVVGPFLKFMVKAINDPEHPYFLCLDEMNLAPVEQYFAEYLSVVESRKVNEEGKVVTDPIIEYEVTEAYNSLIDQLITTEDKPDYKNGKKRLSIPQNLIVIGTVNMDETTFSFSRKVLDRAMTIEMNEVDLNGGLTNRYEKIGKLGNAELVGTAVEGVDVYSAHKGICDKVIAYLKAVNEKLEGTPFKIAYRTRNEFLLYVVNNLPYNKDKEGKDLDQNFVIARALDEITNMKILSRVEGDETKVSKLFNNEVLKSTIKTALTNVYAEYDTETSISLAKLIEMKDKLESGYTSFWS